MTKKKKSKKSTFANTAEQKVNELLFCDVSSVTLRRALAPVNYIFAMPMTATTTTKSPTPSPSPSRHFQHFHTPFRSPASSKA